METELKASLLRIAELYARSTGLKFSTIGMRVARDARFFDRLRDGCAFQVRTYDQVMAYFSDHWPEALSWPDDIPRPAAAAA